LALEYVQVIIDAQAQEIVALHAEIESMQATMKDLVRMASTEKPAGRAKAEKAVEPTE
jgi:Tfp pilus assembly protein PilN